MAGYVTRLNGHVYDGHHIAAEALCNGEFVELDATGQVAKISAAKDTILRVAPGGKETLWGMDALRLDVVSVGADEVFFVENEWDVDDTTAYDTSLYTLPAGKLVKMKRLLPGEQIIVSVDSTLYTAVNEFDLLTPADEGTVALVSQEP